MHKRSIRAVFEQAPHQIGQQILVIADRRINPAGASKLLKHCVVQCFAHAVQTLKFKLRFSAGQLQNRRNRMRIVGRELRIKRVACFQHSLGAGQIGNVGAELAREHRIIAKSLGLRAFDFRIPIGAFHQPQRDPLILAACERHQPVDDRQRALLIGLHRDAEALIRGKSRIAKHAGKNFQRQIEALALFGIHGQRDLGHARLQRQIGQALGQHGHRPIALRVFVTRMQGGQLDRDAGRIDGIVFAWFGLARRRNRMHIGSEVVLCGRSSQRGFAQHIERIAVPGMAAAAALLQRCLNVAADDELPGQDAHRAGQCQPHHLCAAGRD